MDEVKRVMPDGYMEDSQGRLVPNEMVKAVDKLRDDLVRMIVKESLEVSTMLAAFKKKSFEAVQAFCDLSAAEYDRDLGGTKGNVTLLSYDGRYKVSRAIGELFVFDERLQTAKQLIDECIRDWSEDSKPEMLVLINDSFQVDKQGNVNIKRILSLRKFAIDDSRWQQAMKAISDSLTVAGSRVYLRVYERIEGTEQWRQIPLDIAGV